MTVAPPPEVCLGSASAIGIFSRGEKSVERSINQKRAHRFSKDSPSFRIFYFNLPTRCRRPVKGEAPWACRQRTSGFAGAVKWGRLGRPLAGRPAWGPVAGWRAGLRARCCSFKPGPRPPLCPWLCPSPGARRAPSVATRPRGRPVPRGRGAGRAHASWVPLCSLPSLCFPSTDVWVQVFSSVTPVAQD